jgi:hypothetical protein
MSVKAAFKRIRKDSGIITSSISAGILSLRLAFVLSGLLLFLIPAVSQIRSRPKYRFEADFGYGFPEALGIKFKYGNKIQAGLVQSLDSRGLGATGIEIYYHMGEKPRLMDQAPWYVAGGIAGYLIDVDYTKEYNVIIYLRAGRSFNISRTAGINLDVGPGFPLGRNNSSNNPIAPILFTGSLTIFIRF